VIPVETPSWRVALDLLDWQTLIAGVLALLAAWFTIRATKRSADREIEASQAQTAIAQKQIDTTVRLEQERVASEASAFRTMLEAAMKRVLDEAASARKTYPQDPKTGAFTFDHRPLVCQCITKGAFAELRAACVRQGSLTSEFLDLEREIDSFALPQLYADLGEQLDRIETMAAALREKAVERFR
jgi:hypothetical protein